jgi:hypothetical protein
MSGSGNTSYSLAETITSIRDYYSFLTNMYLKESDIMTPPPEGWPHIGKLRSMGKTNNVLELLSRLPYVRNEDDVGVEVAPGCCFADWRLLAQDASEDEGYSLRQCSEAPELAERTPFHVIGLTYGSRHNSTFLLDTQRGIVHWYECPDQIRRGQNNDPNWVPPVNDIEDPYDWAPERETDWCAEHPAWAVADLFKILKGQFLQLNFVPISPRTVYDVYSQQDSNKSLMLSTVQGIYRQHGWPDLHSFRKQECLQAVKAALKEQFPNFVEESEDEDILTD